MLDPAGDAQHTGRQLEDSFERGITLQCAEQLKKVLEKEFPSIRVVLTRVPGETLQPLQNAHFANRLRTDLYIRLQLYHESHIKPRIALYYVALGDEFITRHHELNLLPYDQAHIANHNKTKSYANLMLGNFKQCSLFDVQGIYGIPFKPLMGIQAPAIAIEIGLPTKNSWQEYINALHAAISNLIRKAMV